MLLLKIFSFNSKNKHLDFLFQTNISLIFVLIFIDHENTMENKYIEELDEFAGDISKNFNTIFYF